MCSDNPDVSQELTESQSSSSLGRQLIWVAAILGAVITLVGAGHLAIWLDGYFSHRVFTYITMKSNAALGMTICGISVLLLVFARAKRPAEWTVRFFAFLVFLLGVLSLCENLFGWNFVIDQLIATEMPGAPGVVAPNRMGTPAALGFALAAPALYLFSRRKQVSKTTQFLPLAVSLVGLLGTLGFLYGALPLYGATRATAVAFPTALCLISLGFAILCLRPNEGFMATFIAGDAGGHAIRYLLPWCIGLPLIVGYMQLYGVRRGLYDMAMGAAIVMVVLVCAFAGLIYRSGAEMSRREATERQIREMLRQSEQRYRTLFANMTEAFALGEVIFDNRGAACNFRFVEVNEGFELHTGLKKEDVVGRPITEALPNLEQPWIETYCRVAVTGMSVRFEEFNKDTNRYYNVSCFSPSYGKFAILFYDDTERRNSEKQSRQAAERLSLAQRAGRTGVFDWNLTSNETFWTPELEEIFGLPHGGFENHYEGWAQYVHPEDLARIEALFSEWLNSDRNEADWEYRFLRDGEERWVSARASIYRDAAGKPVRMIGTNLDITERKRAEQALRESEARYRTLFNSIDEGFCIIQMIFDENERPIDYRFLEVNPSFQKQTGLANAQGKRIREMVPLHEAHWFEIYGQIALTGRPQRFQNRSDQLNRWFDVYAFQFGSTEKRQVAVLFKDITEQQQVQEELVRAKAEAEHANRAKDHFLAVLSHELRTPLTPVVMGLSLLQEKRGLDTNTRETLDLIRSNVEMESRLIDDLLDVTRIARGKIELNKTPVEIGRVIQRAIDVCKPDIEARRLHFGVDMGPSPPYWVKADVSRLQQVFWNLLKNAIKFTPNDGCVGIRCRPNNEHVAVEVNDSGIGIKPRRCPGFSTPWNRRSGQSRDSSVDWAWA